MTPRLLITGASGFVGWPCIRAAQMAGFEVHAVSRSQQDFDVSGVVVHNRDLMDPDAVLSMMKLVCPTHLLHLAWVTTPGVYWTTPENWDWVQASQQVITAFVVAGGQRAVLAGSCAEYDWKGTGVCHETTTPIRPVTVYGHAKVALASWVTETHPGLSHSWARLFFLYGRREHPARLVPSVVRSLLNGESAHCTAGTQMRDFLSVEDVAQALIQLVLSNATGPVNIGSGEPIAVKTIVNTLADIVGRPDLIRLGAKPTPPNDPQQLVADVTRLREDLHWSPSYSLRRGLEETVAWWRSHLGQ